MYDWLYLLSKTTALGEWSYLMSYVWLRRAVKNEKKIEKKIKKEMFPPGIELAILAFKRWNRTS